MKNFLAAIFIILISCWIYAQPKPYVEQEKAVYSNFKYEPVLVHVFEIRNIGDETLEILNARPT